MKKNILTAFLFFSVCLFVVGESQAKSKEKEKWNEYKSYHFIIYYKNAPKDFVENVEEAAERYYDEITENLGFTRYSGWTFDRRAKIYIYDSQQDYIENAGQYAWSHGAAYADRKEIRTFPSAHGFFDSTLPHELGHIVFREFVGYKSRIPLWMDEGVAMYQEKAKRWGANAEVKKAIENGTFIPVQDLTWMSLGGQTSQATLNLFYAESASLVYFLINEYGLHRFGRFCRHLEQGEKFEWALKKVYVRFRTLEDFNRAWVRYLKNE